MAGEVDDGAEVAVFAEVAADGDEVGLNAAVRRGPGS
jgi:hypothetical protein